MTPERRPALWCDVLQPAPVELAPDPLASAEGLQAAAEILRAVDNPAVRAVGAGLAEWLQRGGDLPRLLGVRGRRGQRAIHARQQQQQRAEALAAAAVAAGATSAQALARIVASDTDLGRELRAAGVARSPRQLRRVLAAGVARRRDTSS